MEDLKQLVKDTVEKNKVAVFMKGTPDMPQCGFSARVAGILEDLDVKFASVNIYDDHPNILNNLREVYGWPTSPQVFIDGELIGGCDITMEMYESGELQKKLGVKA
ncbi:MAG: Grx4 family monothiol glutaredoxin [Candidatus Sericytochromatia bacterium]|nr:Grx4 family monothiol glutaredoxin [Candidatus Sericytochromatia bacterium]